MGDLESCLNIPRDIAIKLGREAMTIARRGNYQAPSGRMVSITDAVRLAVSGTQSYPPGTDFRLSDRDPVESKITVENTTTLEAARLLVGDGGDAVVLNFADPTTPGGGFLTGALAQEEYLTRSSALIACLEHNEMYSYHRAVNDALSSDYVIYSPSVPVFRKNDRSLLEEPYCVGILTSPAVRARRVAHDRRSEIKPAMRSRIHKVLAGGLAHGHMDIVLGAWGCGAFGHDTKLIARLFGEALHRSFAGRYRRVIFAVTDWSLEQQFIRPFTQVFDSPPVSTLLTDDCSGTGASLGEPYDK
jgi:uncharacterized protein (TIGR02452 family)